VAPAFEFIKDLPERGKIGSRNRRAAGIDIVAGQLPGLRRRERTFTTGCGGKWNVVVWNIVVVCHKGGNSDASASEETSGAFAETDTGESNQPIPEGILREGKVKVGAESTRVLEHKRKGAQKRVKILAGKFIGKKSGEIADGKTFFGEVDAMVEHEMSLAFACHINRGVEIYGVDVFRAKITPLHGTTLESGGCEVLPHAETWNGKTAGNLAWKIPVASKEMKDARGALRPFAFAAEASM